MEIVQEITTTFSSQYNKIYDAKFNTVYYNPNRTNHLTES